jgi:hypothetical protein
LPGCDRIPGELKETGLCLLKERIHGRIQLIEILAKAQAVELIAAFVDCFGDRGANNKPPRLLTSIFSSSSPCSRSHWSRSSSS